WIPCLLSRGMAMAQRRCSTIGISYLDTLSTELSLKLMAPCKFKQMDLSRLDPATRFEIYEKATAMQILTPEEIKKAEGF
ncbi:hypothetical protein ACK3YB_19860, partial [Aeromonas caviae]